MELTNDDDLTERDFHFLYFSCVTTSSTMDIIAFSYVRLICDLKIKIFNKLHIVALLEILLNEKIT